MGRVDLTSSIVSRIVKSSGDPSLERDGFKPFSTNIENDSLSFNPGYTTGTAIRLSQDAGGQQFGDAVLKADVDYYLRRNEFAKYGFYRTQQDAINGTNVIRLNGEVARAGIFASEPSQRERIPLATGRSFITLSPNPDLATGTLVRLTKDSGGLKADTNYYVANRLDSVYSFFASRADAKA